MLSLDNNLTIFIYIQGDFLSFQVLNILLVPRQGYDLYFMCGLRAICNGNTVIKACDQGLKNVLEGSSLSIITDIHFNQNYNKISLIGQCMCHASNLTVYLDSLHVVPG